MAHHDVNGLAQVVSAPDDIFDTGCSCNFHDVLLEKFYLVTGSAPLLLVLLGFHIWGTLPTHKLFGKLSWQIFGRANILNEMFFTKRCRTMFAMVLTLV